MGPKWVKLVLKAIKSGSFDFYRSVLSTFFIIEKRKMDMEILAHFSSKSEIHVLEKNIEVSHWAQNVPYIWTKSGKFKKLKKIVNLDSERHIGLKIP